MTAHIADDCPELRLHLIVSWYFSNLSCCVCRLMTGSKCLSKCVMSSYQTMKDGSFPYQKSSQWNLVLSAQVTTHSNTPDTFDEGGGSNTQW
jgi:hypothetical protein